MKKALTLFALMACFMGVRAVEIVDAEVDFSKMADGSEIKFYGWGASDSAKERLSIKDGCLHFESTEATDPSWDCQFHPIGGVSAEVDVTYTLHYKIKGDHDGNVSMLGFGQTPYGAFAITTDWVEGTVDYLCTSASGDILMQCGDWVGTWDIAYLKITHEGKVERPVEWIEMLTNGDAETPWTEEQASTAFDDQENNFKICAWGKVEQGNPFPAEIVELEEGGHSFIVRAAACVSPEEDASAWDNQFWIQAPRQIREGEQLKLHFRYKASQDARTSTQIHHQNPSDYMHYVAIGEVSFTTEWQEFDQTITWPSGGDNKGWSIAFNLNSQVKDAVDFYFDDLSIQEMKLEKGLFVAASNTATGIEYDFDNATPFVYDESLEAYVATVGTEGNQDSWVNQVMISTVRGNDRSFKSATIKPSGEIDGTEDTWLDYTESSNAKVDLPAAGVWQIGVDTENMQINFYQIEGDEIFEKVKLDEIPNPTEVVVHGQERDFTSSEQPADEEAGIEAGTGQAWDNQFFIVANRELKKGEVTVVKFKYKSSIDAHTTTQLHGDPGAYMHWSAIGNVDFVGGDEWKDFEYTLTIPAEADGMKSIAFNMAEIKEACDYYIKDVVWMTEDMYETLIDTEGTKNFYVKEGAGTSPYEFGHKPVADVKGDVNSDGSVDVADISAIISVMAGTGTYENADVNGDGTVDVADISTVISIMAASARQLR